MFYARSTRDGVARARDGQVYLLINELGCGGVSNSDEVEILFEDGVWMLASRSDLGPLPQRPQ